VEKYTKNVVGKTRANQQLWLSAISINWA